MNLTSVFFLAPKTQRKHSEAVQAHDPLEADTKSCVVVEIA
jgi:hypothetical protein